MESVENRKELNGKLGVSGIHRVQVNPILWLMFARKVKR